MNKIEVINRLKPILYNLKEKNTWLTGKLSMALAQILIESAWLKSSPQNNCLGIKVPKVKKKGIWIPSPRIPENRRQLLWTHEWNASKNKYIKVQDWFMTYQSIEACIESGYIKILELSRYKETRDCINWWDSTNYIRINGYATSPTYTDTLRNLILKEKLYTIDWTRDYNWPMMLNFDWGETFSPVRFKGKTYPRVIEAPKILWPNIVELAKSLQIGREIIDQPFIITPNGAWGRITEYNFQCGGALDSQHLYWNAADIYTPKGLTTYQFYKIMLEKTDCPRFGIGSNFLHIDRKKDKDGNLLPETVWNYK